MTAMDPEDTSSEEEPKGRAELLQEIISAHVPALYRAAYHLVGNREDAQDLVQETFLRAWRSLDRFAPSSNPRAWLYKILMNLHVDFRRKTARRPEIADLVDMGEVDDLYLYKNVVHAEDLAATDSPESAFFEGFLGDEVRHALAALPEQYKMTILLSAMEGFSYQEIAEVLGIPIGTVMSRLHRARTLLQKSLWDYCVQSGMCKPPRVTPAPVTAACADACQHLYGFLDRELDDATLTAVQGHLDACRPCCDRLEFQQRLNDVIRSQLGKRRVPRKFKERLTTLASLL